jgi:rare lipoprotein A
VPSSPQTVIAFAFQALRRIALLFIATIVVLLAVGCHHNTRQQAYYPPPPAYRSGNSASNRAPAAPPAPVYIPPPTGSPSLIQTGLASWYGPSGHRSADGSVYDGQSLTAANRTLPLGTTVRVTNLATGQQITVRITDRGPFNPSRILDLSEAAAKAVGLYRMGVAQVRLEVFPNPSADPSGRWAVQTGAFKAERDALSLQSTLLRRYPGARVTEFAGSTGFWVRIDPRLHSHSDAVAILDWIAKPNLPALPYLVRID